MTPRLCALLVLLSACADAPDAPPIAPECPAPATSGVASSEWIPAPILQCVYRCAEQGETYCEALGRRCLPPSAYRDSQNCGFCGHACDHLRPRCVIRDAQAYCVR